MRYAVLLSTLWLPALVGAQVLDTIIRFPNEVEELFYVPQGNKLYVETILRNPYGFRTYILDCSTYAVRRALPDVGQTGWLWHAAYNWRRDKVYCVPNDDHWLTIIDNATDSTLALLPIRGGWQPLYNSVNDRVYVSGEYGGTEGIVVIDGATDSVVHVIPLGGGLRTITWNPLENKVYAGYTWSNHVAVVDCVADTLVATIRSRVSWPNRAVYNPLHHKLYLGSDEGGGGAAIDCVADTLIRFFRFGFSNWVSMVLNPVENKVYWPVYLGLSETDSVCVVDCATDSIVAWLAPPGDFAHIDACCYVPWSNRVYVGTYSAGLPDWLMVIDCAADTVMSLVQLRSDGLPAALVANPNDQRVYMSVFWDSAVNVYRDEVPAVSEKPATRVGQFTLTVWPNPVTRAARVWFDVPRATGVSVTVLDACGRVVRTLASGPLGPGSYEHRLDAGASLPAGIYVVNLAAGGRRLNRKLVLTR